MIVYLVLLPGFTYIPMPVIASMLMVSACRLIPFKVMANLLEQDASEFVVLIFTWLVCIFVDGAVGLMAGGVIALLRFAALNWVSQIYPTKEGEIKYVTLEGNLNYINCGDAEVKI